MPAASHKPSALAAVLLFLVPLSGNAYLGGSGIVTRPLRIGFQNTPPYHFLDSNYQPAGPDVDILNAAAHRSRISLVWVFSPEGPEKALSSGAVDLWPLIGDLPERRQLLYVSSPWAEMTYALVFPASASVSDPNLVSGRSLAVQTSISSDVRVAQLFFPSANVVPVWGSESALQAVCNGDAAMGLVSFNAFVELKRPDNCSAGLLQITPIPGGRISFGVGAHRGSRIAEAAADVLRDEIGRMAADGSLAPIDFRWNSHLAAEVSAIF